MALDALTTDVFLPHGQCILWKPEVLWLHVVSDSLIALAYLAIPLSLLYFVQRRKDIPFSGMFLMFGAFIVACGTTHVMEVWTLWSPSYWLSGGIKALTAFISVATAVQLIPLIPKALALRSPAALEEINRSLEREVVERKRTEEKLRESEERFRLVFEGAPIGMGTAALDYRFMKVNKKLCDMLGYRESELMERTFTDITHPDDKTDTIQIAQQVMKTTDIQVYEKRFITKAGETVWGRVTVSLLLDQNGAGLCYVGMVENITHRKALEDQLRQAQKMEAVGQLAGGIAHDFNNLMMAVRGFADLLLTRLPPDSPYRSNVEQIQQAGDRAITLTRQLLAFSRRQMLLPKIINLNAVATNICQMLNTLIGEHITLTLELAPDLQAIKADPGQVEQVICNLAVNARDAMSHGGRLTIETRNVVVETAGSSEQGSLRPGSYVMMAVSDTGCGMDRATQDRIFEPFFSTKEQGKGTGLGLATVYGIITQSDGHIHVDSAPGRGTTFKIYFPRVLEQAKEVGGSRPLTAQFTGSETVLLVEDDEMIRFLVTEMLESHGYRVLAAKDGGEAVSISHDYPAPIHMLLTDVVMPGIRGPEVANQVRCHRPDIHVVYMSGYTDHSHLRQGLETATAHFLQKPVTCEVLIQTLRKVLDNALIKRE